MRDVFHVEPEVFNGGIYDTEAVTYGFSMCIVLGSHLCYSFLYGFAVFEPRFCIHLGSIGAFLGFLLVEVACFQVYYM